MSELVPVHGGMSSPVNRIIPLSRRKQFLKETAGLPSVVVHKADKAVVYRICDGTMSPLTGSMTEDLWHQVAEQEYLEYNFQKYAWTIPIALPLSDEEASAISWGKSAALKDDEGNIFGIIKNTQIYSWDKAKYVKTVYGTERTDHPGGDTIAQDPRTQLIGGEIWALPQAIDPAYNEFVLTPRQSRFFIEEQKWERALAFQTRNSIHMAHEFALTQGVEKLTREKFFTGVVLNPLIGKLKPNEAPAKVRMQGYHRLLENQLFGQGLKNTSLWESRGYDLNEVLALIGLDVKMYHGGPKEAVMHAIYRQNHGFTDLMVGARHAHSNFSDGTPLWGEYDACSIFDNLKGDLKINPCLIGGVAYFEDIGTVGLVEDHPDEVPISVHASDLEQVFLKGGTPDPHFMRPEISQLLKPYYDQQNSE